MAFRRPEPAPIVLAVSRCCAALTGVLTPSVLLAETLSDMPAGGVTLTTVTTGVPAAVAVMPLTV